MFLGFLISLFILSSLVYGAKTKITLTIITGATSSERKLVKEAASQYMKTHPHVQVKTVGWAEEVEKRLAYYFRFFEAKSPKIDLFEVDVIWPGLMARHFLDLNRYGAKKYTKHHFASIVQNNTVDKKLVAMPWFIETGLLYYRTDLLQKYQLTVPQTWDELERAAQIIQKGERAAGNKDFWGFVWQGNAYEGLTCDALEWVYSNGGGTIISHDKKITINNPRAVEIIDRAAQWVGTISPEPVTQFTEELTRNVWQSGNVAFMRNWPYCYSLGNSKDSAVKGKFGICPVPAGKSGHGAATLGGWHLAVSKYSKNPKQAADLAFFMTSYKEQKRRALSSFFPTIKKLYQDRDLAAKQPILKDLYAIFNQSVARPSTPTAAKYTEVSSKFYFAVHSVLTGKQNAATALQQLEKDLQKITGFKVGKVK